MDKWTCIYKTRNIAEANIIKGMLEGNNIPVIIINKQDSSYLNFGDIEIHVATLFKDMAAQLVDQGLMN